MATAVPSFHPDTPTAAARSGGGASAEWDAIQAAIDTMMADQAFTTVTASAAAAFITDRFDFDPGAGTQTLSSYLRDSSATDCYTWAASGRILTQVAPIGNLLVCP